jgi:hypothetical protein
MPNPPKYVRTIMPKMPKVPKMPKMVEIYLFISKWGKPTSLQFFMAGETSLTGNRMNGPKD